MSSENYSFDISIVYKSGLLHKYLSWSHVFYADGLVSVQSVMHLLEKCMLFQACYPECKSWGTDLFLWWSVPADFVSSSVWPYIFQAILARKLAYFMWIHDLSAALNVWGLETSQHNTVKTNISMVSTKFAYYMYLHSLEEVIRTYRFVVRTTVVIADSQISDVFDLVGTTRLRILKTVNKHISGLNGIVR